MGQTAKPFVKWAGGKSRLVHEIDARLPQDMAAREDVVYVEPFVGGGAVLFWILQKYPNIARAVINDINPDLITAYEVVKHTPERLVSVLRVLQREYCGLTDGARREFFMEQRERFNRGDKTTLDTAALLIFLNKTCFNGLYRVNSRGQFNVPHGRYANPKICDEDTIMADSELLQRVEITCGDFADSVRYAGAETIYYFDPPYKPLSKTSSFTSYSTESFGDDEHLRLRDFCCEVSRRGSRFVLSNSDLKVTDAGNEFFDDIYRPFNIGRVLASRFVNADGAGRGRLSELLVSNNMN